MAAAGKKGVEGDLVPQVYAWVVFAAFYIYIAFAFGWRWSLGAMVLLSAVTAVNVYATEKRIARAGATTHHHVLAGLLFGAVAFVMPQWSLLGYHLWKLPLFARAASWLHTRVVAPVLFPKKKTPPPPGAFPS